MLYKVKTQQVDITAVALALEITMTMNPLVVEAEQLILLLIPIEEY